MDRSDKKMDVEAVRLQELSVGYDKRVVIDDIDLCIKRGEIITLIGPNGAGKSTILKTISKQLTPLSGCVYINGRETSSLSHMDMARVVSVLLTERIDPELMTARDVVEMGRYPYTGPMGILSDKDRDVVKRVIELCDLSEIIDKNFQELSDGQRQRVLLCRTLAQEPEIMLLDEPTSYLDIKYKISLLKLLSRLKDEMNMTIVMSLHEFELAKYISDRVICVKGDRIRKTGPPEEIICKEVLCDLYDIKGADFEILLKSIGSMI